MHCFFGLLDFLHIGPLFVRDVELVWVGNLLPEELVNKQLSSCKSLLAESVSELRMRRIRQYQLPLIRRFILWTRGYGGQGCSKRQDARGQDRKATLLRNETNGRPTTPCGEVTSCWSISPRSDNRCAVDPIRRREKCFVRRTGPPTAKGSGNRWPALGCAAE
jgi:hypothetical protein